MLTNFLECWDFVKQFFRIFNLCFDLTGKRETISQFCALMKPLADLSTKLQNQSKPMGWVFIGTIHVMRDTGCLNPSQNLTILGGTGTYAVLHDEVKEARIALCNAIDQRFFIPRYLSRTQALVLEYQVFCIPAMKYLDTMRDVIRLVYANMSE